MTNCSSLGPVEALTHSPSLRYDVKWDGAIFGLLLTTASYLQPFCEWGRSLKKQPENPWKIIGLFGSLGVEILLFIVGGAWLGRFLDDKWGSFPTWTATGLLGGMLLGGVSTFMAIRFLRKK
ncbi:hypothetical protein GCM10007416_18790 [Kroppenstedtia guangzhouensis]|uniref:F0F1-ATPase subunit Ca2+/Mg2+ transporter n=1 Tax=Kroppenstedtia guangzhouensis TaxID=1274356 RepID=A0ABQ1GKW6_9BACL|nr:hypothetical protein GCM10007416_18790 [Kroppenstedtia guangzhouensis]